MADMADSLDEVASFALNEETPLTERAALSTSATSEPISANAEILASTTVCF